MADPAAAPAGPLTPSPALPGIPVAFPPGFPSLNLTVGAVTISTWLSIFLFGVVCAATYIYYLQFPRDRLGFKLLAFTVWFLAATDTVSNCIWAYEWTVTLWGSIPGAGIIPYGFYVNILCVATTTAVTQFFYAWRLWLISGGNYVLCGLIVSAAITQEIIVIWALSVWGSHHALISEIGLVLPGAYGWLIAGIIGDTIISISMFWFLRIKTRDTPTPSKTTFNAIISRTVQANVFSLISQTLTFVLFKLDVGMFFFLNDVTICKVYAFSLLTSLNARRSSTAMFNLSRSQISTGPTSNNISLNQISANSRANRPPVVRITETVEMTTEADWDQKNAHEHGDWDSKDSTAVRSPISSSTSSTYFGRSPARPVSTFLDMNGSNDRVGVGMAV
ncbi:hypothetical protein EXIGLDRAFT_834769 [Exidia glandulosa HHB12029]|uniref:DUF6534 domain-containing protein n=1 Tax=Exidia glandulosa HHB12029 TaxID=1314781 RepID=A0A165JGB6_EXIGL|nr:hypothetical protein EXIGLDRAFT_834769 [Exidia glandulosa HHB12029]